MHSVLESAQFLMPKSGHTLRECEDAVAANNELGRYALADGATEAFDAVNWARKLTEAWIAGNVPASGTACFREWVVPLGKELHASWEGLSLPWYAEEKARHGSFAAFVGLEFGENPVSLKWRAISLGDSCLIHIKRDGNHMSWPIEDYRAFNSAPILVPSSTATQATAFDRTRVLSGRLGMGEVLLLLSDAIACWFISRAEAADPKRFILGSLFDLYEREKLEKVFSEERSCGRLKDDDIAIAAIRVAQ